MGRQGMRCVPDVFPLVRDDIFKCKQRDDMVKEPPIQVVNKTRKTAKQKRTKTVRSKSAATGNRKKKKDSEYSSIP